MGRKSRLTKAQVESLRADGKDAYAWEMGLPGFGVRKTRGGAISFIVQYRDLERRSRRMTLGRYPRLSVGAARRKAFKVLAAVEQGENPAQESLQAAQTPTLAEILDRCLAEYASRLRSGELKPRTLKENTWLVQKYLKPAFGKRRVPFVTRADVKRFKDSMSATPILFNRCRSVLCATFDLADEMGISLSEPNPARKVKPFKEKGRKRALKGHEIARLGDALRECEAECVISPAVAACFRLLILTGCRRDEVRTLHWGDVDYEGRCLHLRDSKTGPRDVPLPAAALQVLADLEHGPDERLFPTRSSAGYVSLQRPWRRLCARAGLEDVTLHTLRHTWVTTGISAGLSVKLVGAAVGHINVKTTEGYLHLDLDPLHRTSEAVGGRIAGQLDGNEPAKVVNLSGERQQ